MMRKILIPVDFTPATYNLLDYTLNLANKMECEIRLFHVVDDPFVKEKMPDPPEIIDDSNTEELIYKMQIDAKEKMEQLYFLYAEKIKTGGFLNTILSKKIEVGTVEDKILEEAINFQPDFILMGTHDHKKLGRIFFGTVTQAIIKRATVPVFAIPQDYLFKEIKEIVYLTDLRNDDINSINTVIDLFDPFEIKLHITHFNTDEISDEQKMFELSEQFKGKHKEVKIDYEIIDGKILRDAYTEYIKIKNIDLIAVTTGKSTGFQRFFNPGVAVDVLFHGHLPLLVLHRKEE